MRQIDNDGKIHTLSRQRISDDDKLRSPNSTNDQQECFSPTSPEDDSFPSLSHQTAIKKQNRRSKGGEVAVRPDVLFTYDLYKPSPGFYPKSKTKSKYPLIELHDKFWQTVARVYMKKTGQTDQNNDPDVGIDWENVVAVDVMGEQFLRCPICLEHIAQCPRITRCGHVFCFTCLLRFFNTSINRTRPTTWRKCPICSEIITKGHLRPARIQTVISLKPTIILKSSSTSITCPLAVKKAWMEEATPFDRIIYINDPWPVFATDHAILYAQSRLCFELGESEEIAEVIVEAMEILIKEAERHNITSQRLNDETDRAFKQRTLNCSEPEYDSLKILASRVPTAYDFDHWKILVEDEANEICHQTLNQDNGGDQKSNVNIDEFFSNSDSFHFYQIWDGQLGFLRPVYTRILIHNSVGDGKMPPLVAPDLRILTPYPIILDHATKARFQFLSHLPSGTSLLMYDVNMLYLLRKWIKDLYSNQLMEVVKKHKREEKRKQERERLYAETVLTRLEAKAGSTRAIASHCAERVQEEKRIREEFLQGGTQNFPILAERDNQGQKDANVQADKKPLRGSFRDRAIKTGIADGLKSSEEFPELIAVGNRRLAIPPSPAIAPADDETLNWRTGKPLILRPPQSGLAPSRWNTEAERDLSHKKRVDQLESDDANVSNNFDLLQAPRRKKFGG